jgi:hypothetical protein
MDVVRPSASGLETGLACESSATLPRTPEPPKAHDAPSKKGDRVHAALERYLLGGRKEDIMHQVLPDDCPSFEQVLSWVPKLQPLPGLPLAEAECWLNPLTLEAELGVSGTPRPPGMYRGRTDAIGIFEHPIFGPLPTVMDFKNGAPNYQVGPKAAQLGFFVLWLSIKLEADKICSIVFLTKDATNPRIGVWHKDDIDAFAQKFADFEARMTLLEAGQAEPTLAQKGKYCHWCPAKPVCPRWQERAGDAS